MQVDNCYWVGAIRKAHGIRGEVKAYFDVDHLEEYHDMESVYLLMGEKLVPFFIQQFRPTGPTTAILSLREIRTRDEADTLAGKEMYLPIDQLPDLKEGQFFYHDIIGFQVQDKTMGLLGKVTAVREMPGNDLMVMRYKGADVLVPLNPKIVLRADYPEKLVITDLPEGLVDVYI